jgi:hypothetical protein
MDLHTVQEIERAIDTLTSEQREELYVWLDERYLHAGDMQLKAAIDAGCFDDRISRAIADDKAGRTKPSSAGRSDAPRQYGRTFGKSIGLCPPISATARISNLRCSAPIPATLPCNSRSSPNAAGRNFGPRG